MLKEKWVTKNQNTRLYQIPVPIVGLTGGIASGKSTIADLFRKNNIPVIDADKLVKHIYQNEITINFIKSNFPQAVENNSIVFSRLRELAFTNPQVKKKLEDYIYALLPTEFTNSYKALPPAPFIVYDVPLLFEKGLDQLLDVTLCVYLPRSLQIERLIKRDGITKDLAENILNQQMNIEEKKNKASLVIDNSSDVIQMQEEFNKIFSELVI